jgi:hypothetical protein
MQCALAVCFILWNGVISLPSQSGIKPSAGNSDTSPLTSGSSLRDIVYQESLVRLSLIQKMQKLAIDVVDNRNDSLTFGKKLSDIQTETLSNAAQNQELKKENTQLKKELNTFKNLVMEKIQSVNISEIDVLVKKMADENSKFKLELRSLNETNQRLDEENSKLQQELGELKTASLSNKQGLNNLNATLNKHNDVVGEQLRMINDSLQENDVQLLNISSQLSSSKCMLFI